MRTKMWFKPTSKLTEEELRVMQKRLDEVRSENEEDYKNFVKTLAEVVEKDQNLYPIATSIILLHSLFETTIAILKDVVADLEELEQRIEELEEKIKELEEVTKNAKD